MYRPRLRWAAVPAIVAIVALLAAFASLPVAALQIRRGDVVTIGRDEVVGDTAILAQSAIIEGTVDGDLVIASTEAQITGTVNGRLFWAGEQLTIGGTVADSVYAAGVGLSTGPNASIGRDLAMLGLYLTVAPGSSVGQDVLMAGNQAVVEGTVQRDVRFTGLALQIRGPVGAATISRQAALPGTEASAHPIASQSEPEGGANQALLPGRGPGELLSAAWAGAW
ncbi:MAG: hypothetical protein K6V36_12135 [Anaerolineae bacterium]|nr:hypothetical protein [Anaerolineae bacterium]